MSPFPYSGQISTLEGPIFALVTPLVTNLPVSNHDHSVNGMVFDNNGDLYVCVGGNTNAGIPSVGIGELPETPLSGAVIKVALSEPSFNGAITYVETISGTPNNDQIFGDIVDVAPGIDVGVYASGIRNSLDLVFHDRQSLVRHRQWRRHRFWRRVRDRHDTAGPCGGSDRQAVPHRIR